MRSRKPNKKAANRGMVLNAESCIEVAIWIMLTTIPTANPINSKGAQSTTVVQKAWLIRCTAKSGLMDSSIETLHQRADHQIPAVHQNEQKDLERRGNHNRRQLDHTDGERDRSHYQIDDQEG